MSDLHEEHNRQESHTAWYFISSEVMSNHNYLHFYKEFCRCGAWCLQVTLTS